MKKMILMLLGASLSMLSMAQVQVTTIPYSMSFEMDDPTEAAELQNWVFNPGTAAAQCTEEWIVGRQLHSDGRYGVYVSNDSALMGFGDKPCVQFMYRDFVLPSGNYYVSFDYLVADSAAQLYVGVTNHVGPTAQTNNMQAIFDPISGAVLPNVGAVTMMTALAPASRWTPASQAFSYNQQAGSDIREARVWFAWVGNAHDSLPGIAAAIDNVQITDARCDQPRNLSVEVTSCDSVVFSWEGGATRYRAEYRPMGSTMWRARNVRDAATSIVIESMEEGNYDFRVRGECYEAHDDGTVDTIISPYAFLGNVNIFCPDRHCINYVDIVNPNVATCTYGKTTWDGYAASWRSAFDNEGVVDFGWDNINSRHTVVWDTLATDPQTNGMLRMVPVGEAASVRLGNWETGNGAEAISYDFMVDEDNSILLIKYAIVLEDPDHDADENPRFVIQVFDENGGEIDPVCGKIDLNPRDLAQWITVPGGTSYSTVVYKDWSMLGVSLENYVGKSIKVSFATYDCFLSGHYGYAYFTLGCAGAHIKNTSCGADTNVHVEAPEGFNYLWHNDVNTTTYTTRDINIGLNEPTDWTCTLTSKEKAQCSFDLYVNTEPRYPVANFSYKYEPSNCENRYVFDNHSFIRVNQNGHVKDYYDEPCDAYEWDFGFDDYITDQKNPGVVVFPDEGGQFTVTLAAMIGDGTGTCRSDTFVILDVPAVGEVFQRTDTSICEGNYVMFHGDGPYFTSGVYEFGGPDPVTGCMTMDTLYLTVVPTSTTILDSMAVCYGDSIYVGGKAYYRTDTSDVVITLQNYLGCDSLLVFHVDVAPQILPTFDVQKIDEEHEYASIDLSGTGFTKVFVDGEQVSTLSFTNLEAGNYYFSLRNDMDCRLDTTINVGGCLRNIVYQRWDDVISLMNKDYNGGLVFTSYQWYKDGVAIEGATKSYYYQEGGLTPGASYVVGVIMEDGSENFTCDFFPTVTARTGVRVSPTHLAPREPISVSTPAAAEGRLYTMMGQVVSTFALVDGDNYVPAPAAAGLYLLTVEEDGVQRSFRICVTK